MSKNYFFFPLFLAFLSSDLYSIDFTSPQKTATNHVLFLLQKGHIEQSLQIYNNITSESGKHDLDLLQHIGMGILERGSASRDPEISLLSIFGAGVSLNEKALHILEEGMRKDVPQHQLVSLNFLSRYQHADARKALEIGLRSQFLPIRMESALYLCSIKEKTAFSQAESLMHKIGPNFTALFPQFFASLGDASSIRTLKQLLNHSNVGVRVEAVQSVVRFHRDELLPLVRTLSTHLESAQQEACAFALGHFRDEASLPRLEILSKSKALHVRLTAMHSLLLLGKQEYKNAIVKAALEGDTFAITLLGTIPETEDPLYSLTLHDNLSIRINATLALLEHSDPRCVKTLLEILIRDTRDLAFIPTASQGKSLHALKVVPSASQNLKDTPVYSELSLTKREEALVKAADLTEDIFLQLVEIIFKYEQNDLVPLATKLLENLQTQNSIALLKCYSQKIGAPLIRNYCNLALYRIGEQGPYFENLKNWILSQQHTALIRFRPVVPFALRSNSSTYQMTPDETSRLLVESFESFLQIHDDRGIDILIQTIQNGNTNNKYILAGLLMRATL